MPNKDFGGLRFLAPQGRFKPSLMFTKDHIIAATVCIAVVLVALLLTRNHRLNTFTVRIFAVFITLLEVFKITVSFVYNDLALDSWFPLSYCGLFIFALWMSGFGKGCIKDIGDSFIAYGCTIGGLAFLIFPTTSLMLYPIWHYFSLYSLLFHTLMIFFGIKYLKDEDTFNFRKMLRFSLFIIAFAIPATILNHCFDSNLMNLSQPFNIPIAFVQGLYQTSGLLYSIYVLINFLLIPLVTAFLSRKIKFKSK